ncbi:MAG TPA: branched-chain amino acid ABC transporter permease [Acidimicrobiales bacterium]|nr:branched-chain amino acid ABC transporter permease [Acidimicrobiales bacterium]
MNLFVSALAAALAFSAYTAVGSLGFSLQYATTNVLNLAYGDLMIVAGYVTYTVHNAGANIFIAAAAGVAATCVASYALSRWLLIPALRRGMSQTAMILLTLGLSIMIEAVINMIWGANSESFGLPAEPFLRAGSFSWTSEDFASVVCAIVLLAATYVLLEMTSLGRQMRAIASNKELATTCGVAADRVTTASWVISGLLCGIAGVLLSAETVSFNAVTGFTFTVVIVAAAFVGGIGQMGGAVIGALVVGFVSQFAAAYSNPAYVDVFAFGLLALVLLVRPRGIISDIASQRELVA